jgi:hypothetical protein
MLRVATDAARRLDEAIAAFRGMLPDHGLKLIVPPPLPGGSAGRMALSAWRRGEVTAPVHAAARAGEALLQLVASEAERDRQALVQKRCARCRGIGWTITPVGARAMCPHPEAQR